MMAKVMSNIVDMELGVFHKSITLFIRRKKFSIFWIAGQLSGYWVLEYSIWLIRRAQVTSHSWGLLITKGYWQEGGCLSPSPAFNPGAPPSSWLSLFLLSKSCCCSYQRQIPELQNYFASWKCLFEFIRTLVFDKVGFSVELELFLRDCCSQDVFWRHTHVSSSWDHSLSFFASKLLFFMVKQLYLHSKAVINIHIYYVTSCKYKDIITKEQYIFSS